MSRFLPLKNFDKVKNPPPPELPSYEYDGNPGRFDPGGQNDIILPQIFINTEKYKALIKALKVVSGLAYELNLPIALMGGLALNFFGYYERVAGDIDLVTTDDSREKIISLVKSKNERYTKTTKDNSGNVIVVGGLAFEEGEVNNKVIYYITKVDDKPFKIKIDLVAFETHWKLGFKEADVIQRSVAAFERSTVDNSTYRVTRCVIPRDLYEMKYRALYGRKNAPADLSDLFWLKENMHQCLSAEQNAELTDIIDYYSKKGHSKV